MAATHADFTDTFVVLTDLVRDLSLGSSSSSSSGDDSGSSSSSSSNGDNTDRGAKDAAGGDQPEAVAEAIVALKSLRKLVSRCASPKELEEMLRRKMKIHRLGTQTDKLTNPLLPLTL